MSTKNNFWEFAFAPGLQVMALISLLTKEIIGSSWKFEKGNKTLVYFNT